MNKLSPRIFTFLLGVVLTFSACLPGTFPRDKYAVSSSTATQTSLSHAVTPFPTRPEYKPGEMVAYTAQTGDTLPALAAHFNTRVIEIRDANPIIPDDASTMPPGLPMQIPIYYLPLWGSQYQILPDLAFVNGPSISGFDTQAFVDGHAGWLKDFTAYVGGTTRTGAGVVDYVATNFSISPRLLLAILEYQAKAISAPELPKSNSPYSLGYIEHFHRGMYLQLVWAANTLNNGYYGWRTGSLTSFDHPDGRLERPDPWQNAASVGIQYYFSLLFSASDYDQAISSEGLIKTYSDLFEDPWADPTILIPGSLQQPAFHLPFPAGHIWTYTGGPHTGWGEGEPYAGIDFAPPSEHSGCFVTDEQEYSTAVSDGIVVRSETGVVVLDLDGDGDEHTGWTLLYLHLAEKGRAKVGDILKLGDQVGYPSCEGGRTTGTHVHIARKYNGEWIPADGPLAFNLEGWIAHNGQHPYLGTLTKGILVIEACECSDVYSQIKAGD